MKNFELYRKWDKVWVGILAGIFVPIASYGILLTLYDGLDQMEFMQNSSFSPSFRTRTLSLVALCLNVLPIGFFQKRYMYNAMRGIVFPTLLFIGLWIWKYFDMLFA